MRISFDLDQTLLTATNEFPTEKQNLFQKVLRFEPLRLGTINLMKEILEKGHEIWIYTCSSRPKHYVYELFIRHGIEISGIINRKKHVTNLSVEKRTLAKFPPAFGIEIHIDNSDNVKIYSGIFGFNAIIVKPENENWTQVIREKLFPVSVN